MTLNFVGLETRYNYTRQPSLYGTVPLVIIVAARRAVTKIPSIFLAWAQTPPGCMLVISSSLACAVGED
jgi:hypothetical protein